MSAVRGNARLLSQFDGRSLVNLHGRTKRRRSKLRKARDDGVRDAVQTFRRGCVFAERSDGLPGIAADANARINFNFAEHRHSVSMRGLRAFAVPENIHRLSAVRA